MIPIYDMKDGTWSNLQRFCYERNCICYGCLYKQYNDGNCNVKQSLIEKIRYFGIKKGKENTKQWLQD